MPLRALSSPLQPVLRLVLSHRYLHRLRRPFDPRQNRRAIAWPEEWRIREHLGSMPVLPHLPRILLLLRDPRGIHVRERRRAQVSPRERLTRRRRHVGPGGRAIPCRVLERRGLLEAPEAERIIGA